MWPKESQKATGLVVRDLQSPDLKREIVEKRTVQTVTHLCTVFNGTASQNDRVGVNKSHILCITYVTYVDRSSENVL